jgi:hypothetical protein
VAEDAVEDDEPDFRNSCEQALELLNSLRLAVLLAGTNRRVHRLDIVIVRAERDAKLKQPESVGAAKAM